MLIRKNTEFGPKAVVYHRTPDSDAGLVLEVRVYGDGATEYLVTFGAGPDKTFWLYEEELSHTKCF